MGKNENIVTNANKSGHEKRNVPTLRFRQFRDDWSIKRLSDIAEVVGGGTPDTTDSTLWNGDIQWFTPTEVGHSKYVSSSIRTISQLGLKKSSAKKLPAGSILLSSRATVGECSIAQRDCTTNQGFQNLIPKKSVYNEFLYYLTQTKKRHFVKYASGSTFLEISNSEIKKAICAIPDIEEQTEIATFLSAIDMRIEVQNKIISKYETLIKGLCDLLFSNTTTVISPLKSIATINKGQQINGLALAKTDEYYYLNGGISPSGYVQEYNTSENTISISEGGNSCGFVAYNTQKFWSGGHCYTLKIINTKCRSKFLYFYLKHREKDIMQLRVGSGLPNIQKRSLENFAVALPSVEKQCYIEHILECITAKKEIETDLLGQFQSQKKFLLSKMFI